MKRPSMGRRLAALTATATLVLAGAATAAADGLEAVDELGASVDAVTLNACVGEPASAAVSLFIDRRGGGASVYADSALVSVVGASSLPAVSVSIPAPGTITLPDNWTMLSNGSKSSSVTATVMLAAQQAATSGTATVTFTATGARSTSTPSGPLQRLDAVTVNWTVTDCAPPNTPPVLTLPSDITAEATGPLGAVVTYSATANDAEDTLSPTPTCVPASGSTFPPGTTPVNCSVTDSGGLTTTGSFSVTVVDTTPPAITWTGGPTNGATYVYGSVPAKGSCTAFDLVAGSVTCEIDGYSSAVGTHTVTASATDGSNLASESRTYTVEAWTLDGFKKPVDMTPVGGPTVWNTVKGGSTVPLKFEVFAGPSELTDVAAIEAFTAKQVSCTSDGGTDAPVEFTTTGQTVLRYDATAGQFIQNWQTTKTMAGKCYLVSMTTQDGSKLEAFFKIK
jgi:hypothetical protein